MSLFMNNQQLWQRYQDWLYYHSGLELYLDISRMRFDDALVESLIPKFEKAFQKINQVVDKIKNYDNEKEEYLSQLNTLEKSLSDWDEQIGKQKEQYKVNLLVFQ